MAELSQNDGNGNDEPAIQTRTKRGIVLYKTNPSLTDSIPTRTKHAAPMPLAGAMMVSENDGLVLAKGALGFLEEKEVDTEEFVKIYLAGIRKYGELSGAGATMFEFVYRELSGLKAKGKDTVAINYFFAQEWKADLTERSFYRGMKELLTKGFLFRSYAADIYFVNIRYMFNGDRLVLAKSYRRKAAAESLQTELQLGGPDEAS